MPPAEREVVFAAIDACTICRQALAALAVDARPLRSSDETEPRAPGTFPSPGETVGRYQLESVIGRGGMGIVFRATDSQLARTVALKFVGHAATSSQRMRREAQAMARISHPSVVAVYDVGEHDGWLMVSMEWVDGQDLAAWLQSRPSSDEIVAAFMAAALGLAAAHENGIIHRDFKPSNVLVAADKRVKVTDFGLATTSDDDRAPEPRARLTAPGMVAGTPRYMAPEQRGAGDASVASDQYSYAFSFAEALGARSSLELAAGGAPTASAALTAELTGLGVADRIARALGRGVAADPSARFPSMMAMFAAIQPERAPAATRWLSIAVIAAVSVAALAFAGVALRADGEETTDAGQRDGPPSVFACFGGRDALLRCGETERLRESRGDAGCERRDDNGRWVAHGPFYEVFNDRPDRVRRVGLREGGKSHGRQYTFDRNGRLAQVFEYDRGKLDGALISCSETGQVRELKHYADGEPDGESLVFHEDGSLARQTLYRRGERVRTIQGDKLDPARRAPEGLCQPARCPLEKD